MRHAVILVLVLAGACNRREETPVAKPEATRAPLVTVTYSARGIVHPNDEGRTAEALVDGILQNVAPGSWEEPGVEVEIRDRTLTVTASQAVHDELAKYLEKQRAAALAEDRERLAGGAAGK